MRKGLSRRGDTGARACGQGPCGADSPNRPAGLKRVLQAMKTFITTAVAVALGLLSTPTFAGSYVVNGHAASPAEARLMAASGVQPGSWVVNGYGIASAEHASFTPPPATEPRGEQCYYVLDVLLCD